MATLIFEISWQPLVAAQLASVLDNGVERLAATHTENDGRITLAWPANPFLPHAIKWTLIAGVELTHLKAVAAWNVDNVVTLGEADSKPGIWTDEGILPAKAVGP